MGTHARVIKNDIAGKDAECFEVYPAQRHTVNVDNVYWLFVMPPGERMPVGMGALQVLEGNQAMRPFWYKVPGLVMQRYRVC